MGFLLVFHFINYLITNILDYGIGAYFDSSFVQGHGYDHQRMGFVAETILLVVVTMQIAKDTVYWTGYNELAMFVSLFLHFKLHYIYLFVIAGSYVGILSMVFSHRSFLTQLNCGTTSCFPLFSGY